MGIYRSFAAGSAVNKLSVRLILAIMVSSFFFGCGSSHSSKSDKPATAKERPAFQSPEALIYADEAMLRKPYAVIGGTVENVSGTRLKEVFVELELQRRSDGSKVRRSVSTNPPDLASGEKGSYSLKILSDEWSDSRIVSLRSNSRQSEIAYRTLPGARRPLERLPASTTVTRSVQTQRPKRKSGEDEFINTPDNPVNVP